MPRKKYAVFFADPHLIREAWHPEKLFEAMTTPESPTEVKMLRESFVSHYTFMGILTATSPDHLYKLLNDYATTPWADPKLQGLVLPKIGRASMSVGDVVVDMSTGIRYYCAGHGWKTLTFTKAKV